MTMHPSKNVAGRLLVEVVAVLDGFGGGVTVDSCSFASVKTKASAWDTI